MINSNPNQVSRSIQILMLRISSRKVGDKRDGMAVEADGSQRDCQVKLLGWPAGAISGRSRDIIVEPCANSCSQHEPPHSKFSAHRNYLIVMDVLGTIYVFTFLFSRWSEQATVVATFSFQDRWQACFQQKQCQTSSMAHPKSPNLGERRQHTSW